MDANACGTVIEDDCVDVHAVIDKFLAEHFVAIMSGTGDSNGRLVPRRTFDFVGGVILVSSLFSASSADASASVDVDSIFLFAESKVGSRLAFIRSSIE